MTLIRHRVILCVAAAVVVGAGAAFFVRISERAEDDRKRVPGIPSNLPKLQASPDVAVARAAPLAPASVASAEDTLGEGPDRSNIAPDGGDARAAPAGWSARPSSTGVSQRARARFGAGDAPGAARPGEPSPTRGSTAAEELDPDSVGPSPITVFKREEREAELSAEAARRNVAFHVAERAIRHHGIEPDYTMFNEEEQERLKERWEKRLRDVARGRRPSQTPPSMGVRDQQ